MRLDCSPLRRPGGAGAALFTIADTLVRESFLAPPVAGISSREHRGIGTLLKSERAQIGISYLFSVPEGQDERSPA